MALTSRLCLFITLLPSPRYKSLRFHFQHEVPSVQFIRSILSAVGDVITFLSTETDVLALQNLCKMAKIKIQAKYLSLSIAISSNLEEVSSLFSRIETTIKVKFGQTLVLLPLFIISFQYQSGNLSAQQNNLLYLLIFFILNMSTL